MKLEFNLSTGHGKVNGKISHYSASVMPSSFGIWGPMVEANAPTLAAAKVNLAVKMVAALERLSLQPVIKMAYGLAAVIYPTLQGFDYFVINADGRHSSTISGYREQDKAIAAAMADVYQRSWHADIENDISFVDGLAADQQSEMLSWINFQRNMVRLMADGMSANEAHNATLHQSIDMLRGKLAA